MPDSSQIPLFVLICDADEAAGALLQSALKLEKSVAGVNVTTTLADADKLLANSDTNTIFIDPLSLGLDEASEFIFHIRRTLPEIVFVLYVDKSATEEHRREFFRGKRSRFSHYYLLDKKVPVAAFQDELRFVLRTCQSDLSWRMSQLNLQKLLKKAEQLSVAPSSSSEGLALLQEASRTLAKLSTSREISRFAVQKRSVFLSHQFSERDKDYVEGLVRLLRQSHFEVVTGKSANKYVSKAIIDRIKTSEFFVCLMTRDKAKADGTYTTSPWLLEEKGVAVAFGKPLVLMVEEGVTELGGLEGDWQRIHFGATGFLRAALDAVEQLRSYAGGDPTASSATAN